MLICVRAKTILKKKYNRQLVLQRKVNIKTGNRIQFVRSKNSRYYRCPNDVQNFSGTKVQNSHDVFLGRSWLHGVFPRAHVCGAVLGQARGHPTLTTGVSGLEQSGRGPFLCRQALLWGGVDGVYSSGTSTTYGGFNQILSATIHN